MPRARRSRTLKASPEAIWEVVADPHHLPRWWPRLTRVESVDSEHFTAVLATDRGRVVRADQRVLESDVRWRRVWTQELEGTPFAKILRCSQTTVEVAPDSTGGTRVTLELRQSLRGLARFGGFMVTRAARAQLDAALDGLEGICG